MKNAARFVEIQSSVRPKVAVVLGSGLGAFADSLANAAGFSRFDGYWARR